VAYTIEKYISPFKLNVEWMKMEDFLGKIKSIWKPFNVNLREYVPLQLLKKLKEEK